MKDRQIFCTSMQILCLILIHISNTRSATSGNFTCRIAGGHEIDIKQANFVVQVITMQLYYAISMCGGSLVTPLHVITAAHCVNDVKLSDIRVIGGTTYFLEGGHHRRVRNRYVMGGWDIAVLRLQTALRGPSVGVIPLCSVYYDEGDLIKVYGWGKTSEDDDCNFDAKRNLQEVEVPIVNRVECALYFDAIIPRYYFCAGVPGEKDSLGGDSGGPAVLNNQLCGVVSAGTDYPGMGLYVDINYVKSFLRRYIRFPGFVI